MGLSRAAMEGEKRCAGRQAASSSLQKGELHRAIRRPRCPAHTDRWQDRVSLAVAPVPYRGSCRPFPGSITVRAKEQAKRCRNRRDAPPAGLQRAYFPAFVYEESHLAWWDNGGAVWAVWG